MKKYVFYHIYCNHCTEEIVRTQIDRIIFSGLYNAVDAVYCFLAGEEKYIGALIKLLQNSGSKFKIELIGINDNTYERFTIHKIHKYIQPEDKFLYIHSKGTLRNNHIHVQDWRTYMEYFSMRHFDKCLKLLDHYDTVGVNFYNRPFLHYSGNFWWCRGSYFLTLPRLETLSDVKNDRYSYTENYIGLNSPRGICLFDDNMPDHYAARYTPHNYVDIVDFGMEGSDGATNLRTPIPEHIRAIVFGDDRKT